MIQKVSCSDAPRVLQIKNLADQGHGAIKI